MKASCPENTHSTSLPNCCLLGQKTLAPEVWGNLCGRGIISSSKLKVAVLSEHHRPCHMQKHRALWGHVPLEVFVVSGWRSCSLSDSFLILTQIRPHCPEETGLASHQRSATLYRLVARWSLFGNVQSPSLQFVCQLRVLSDSVCPVTGALASLQSCSHKYAGHVVRTGRAKV